MDSDFVRVVVVVGVVLGLLLLYRIAGALDTIAALLRPDDDDEPDPEVEAILRELDEEPEQPNS